MEQEQPDHRVLVAERRREKMRRHLLTTVKNHLIGPDGKIARVDTIIRAAKVSKGTFYKYFASLDEAVVELGADQARQMVLDIEAVHKPLQHPVYRIAMGCQLFLYRSLYDRPWGAFIGHIQTISGDNLMHQDIAADLMAGKREHHLTYDDLELTVDFILGITLQSIRRISSGQGSQAHIQSITKLVLRALDVKEELAASALQETAEFLQREAPKKLTWWKAEI